MSKFFLEGFKKIKAALTFVRIEFSPWNIPRLWQLNEELIHVVLIVKSDEAVKNGDEGVN